MDIKLKLKELLNNSYAVYSNYKVSCILETKDNNYFYGVNVENASYGATICAERSAITNAITNGYKKHDFKRIYIMNASDKIGTCCMLCRQVFLEFFEKYCILEESFSNSSILVIISSAFLFLTKKPFLLFSIVSLAH